MRKIYQGKKFTLSYIEAGDKNKQPVVLLPGGVGEKVFLMGLIKRLSSDYFVIMINTPGAGQSLIDDSANLKNISQAIAVFTRQIGIKHPIII